MNDIRMEVVIIFGPPAVGKMTVGYELAKLTGLKVFHNHMTIEIALNFFDFGQPEFHRLVNEFRQRIFEEVASSNLPGLIFTYVWALDHPSDKNFIDQCCDIFRAKGGAIYFVELEADQEERLKRNASPLRLKQKPSKRDIEASRKNLIESDKNYKLNSNGDFFYTQNYVRINNTRLTPSETAKKITQALGFHV